MTNKDYTAVVLVVDRSGSMMSIAETVESTLKEFVNQQKLEPGSITIDTVFFDNNIENRAHLVDPNKEELDLSIVPGGMTALYDAVGIKIASFGQELSKLPEDKRPGQVIFVIATDGLENSSHEYNADTLGQMIKTQKEQYNWKFTFIGANQDAVLTAQNLNIDNDSSITFAADKAGAQSVLRSMSSYVSTTRVGKAASYSAEDRTNAIGDNKIAPIQKTKPATLSTRVRASTKKEK